MTDARTFIIVGASLAGAKAAQTLRDDGFEGKVVLLGDEPVRPYERPPLSKEYLQGEAGLDKVFVHDEGYYREHDIDLRMSTHVRGAQRQEPGRRALLGGALGVRRGAADHRCGAPPADGARVRSRGHLYHLRTLADSDRLRTAIGDARRVVVIGGGWIGCEVAAAARLAGAEVAIVEAAQLPLERVLGPELGAFYRDVHAEHAVQWHLGSGVEELRGIGSGRGGPAGRWHGSAGRSLRRRRRCDAPDCSRRGRRAHAPERGRHRRVPRRRASPGVFAAGDVASAWHPLFETHIRLEHWSSALNQGPVAAKNMLGQPVPYEQVPYFFSDQYDVGMEYSGYASTWDQVVLSRRAGEPRVHRLLAEGRPLGRRHEREHLGRERSDRGVGGGESSPSTQPTP